MEIIQQTRCVIPAIEPNLKSLRFMNKLYLHFSDDSEFNPLVNKCQESVPPLPFPIKSKDDLINLAIQITIVKVAQELKANHALTLLSAYNIFTEQVHTTSSLNKCNLWLK